MEPMPPIPTITERLANALRTIILNPSAHKCLRDNDPVALRTAEDTLRAYERRDGSTEAWGI